MRWCYGGAKRASRFLANSLDGIDAPSGASWNLPGAVELNVRRQVIRKIDWSAIGKVMFQRELLCSSSNLTKIIRTGVGRTIESSQDEGRATKDEGAKYKNATDQNTYNTF